jgi:hypothetical protein
MQWNDRVVESLSSVSDLSYDDYMIGIYTAN